MDGAIYRTLLMCHMTDPSFPGAEGFVLTRHHGGCRLLPNDTTTQGDSMAFYVTDHLGAEHKLDVPSEYTEEDFLDALSDAHPDEFIPLDLTAGHTIHIRYRFIASFARREPLVRYRPNDI